MCTMQFVALPPKRCNAGKDGPEARKNLRVGKESPHNGAKKVVAPLPGGV